jgi:hypothetical protein
MSSSFLMMPILRSILERECRSFKKSPCECELKLEVSNEILLLKSTSMVLLLKSSTCWHLFSGIIIIL